MIPSRHLFSVGVALVFLCTAAAASVDSGMEISPESFGVVGSLLVSFGQASFDTSNVTAILMSVWSAAKSWLHVQFVHAPTLVLALVVFLVFPAIALLAALARRVARWRHGRAKGKGEFQVNPAALREFRDQAPLWPKKAVLELRDSSGQGRPIRYSIHPPLSQIGRSEDADICINDPTVHRHHAAIHCSDDAEYIVTDLSSGTGNGVMVNGLPVMQQKISHGDEIRLGRARMTFLTVTA